jgi:S1-C subfamily serine protease
MSDTPDTQNAGTAGEPDAPTDVDAAPAAGPDSPDPQSSTDTDQTTETTETPAASEAETAASAEAPTVAAELAARSEPAAAAEPAAAREATAPQPAAPPAADTPAPEAAAPAVTPPAVTPPPTTSTADTPTAPRQRRLVRGSRTAAVGAVVLAAAIAGGGTGAIVAAGLDSDGGTTVIRETVSDSEAGQAVPASSSGASVSDVYRTASPSVVQIEVTMQGEANPLGGEGGAQRALGSGFVYDGSNHVVTNQHVVDSATSVSVTTSDGSTYDARVVGTDPSTDLAVIEVDAPAGTLEPLDLGDSDDLAVGDQVVAIGSPFGLQTTLTSGVVSALDRRITAPDGFSIGDAIQTDAAINHGNSGGPLLNMSSLVVGVNSQIESDSGGNDGIGFAVPSNTVKSVVSSILENGSVEHAYLGVSLATISEDVAGQLGEPAGAAVAEVRDGSPAADAGLRAATGEQTVDGQPFPTGGDVITEADGQAIASSEDLQAAIEAKQPGDTIELTVENGGQTRTVTVTLGNRPAS